MTGTRAVRGMLTAVAQYGRVRNGTVSAVPMTAKRGYRLAKCNVTLVAERSRTGPYAFQIKEELARIIGVGDRVSVKATTSARLGFTGREEGIATIATATLVRA